ERADPWPVFGARHGSGIAASPVVDGDVVRQARALQPRAQGTTLVAECRLQEAPRVVDPVERPEAVDHAHAEPTREERAVAPAPRPVFRQIATEPRDVVAAVVVDDEQPASGPEDPVHLG